MNVLMGFYSHSVALFKNTRNEVARFAGAGLQSHDQGLRKGCVSTVSTAMDHTRAAPLLTAIWMRGSEKEAIHLSTREQST